MAKITTLTTQGAGSPEGHVTIHPLRKRYQTPSQNHGCGGTLTAKRLAAFLSAGHSHEPVLTRDAGGDFSQMAGALTMPNLDCGRYSPSLVWRPICPPNRKSLLPLVSHEAGIGEKFCMEAMMCGAGDGTRTRDALLGRRFGPRPFSMDCASAIFPIL